MLTLNLFASVGNCFAISPPTNTASKYTQRFCTISHFSKISDVLTSFQTHNWMSFLNGALYLLLSSEFMTIKLSSSAAIISPVSVPFNNNSPRDLNAENCNSTIAQSAITCFSFASISFSLTALIHIS